MVPRTEVVTLPADASLDDLRDAISAHPYSRFPVEGEDVDEILGILHVRDVLPILIGTQSARRLDLREIVRPSYVVPSTLPIDDLLGELKREGMHVAIAIDEYGGIAGIVTLEDIIERLVGEVPDEYGQPAMSPQSQDDGSLLQRPDAGRRRQRASRSQARANRYGEDARRPDVRRDRPEPKVATRSRPRTTSWRSPS
ncbi:MAG: CBS domain-containing protein [Thermomicrobiales bacterium]